MFQRLTLPAYFGVFLHLRCELDEFGPVTDHTVTKSHSSHVRRPPQLGEALISWSQDFFLLETIVFVFHLMSSIINKSHFEATYSAFSSV